MPTSHSLFRLQYSPSNGLLDTMAVRFQELQPSTQRSHDEMYKAYSSRGLQPSLPWYTSCQEGRQKHGAQVT